MTDNLCRDQREGLSNRGNTPYPWQVPISFSTFWFHSVQQKPCDVLAMFIKNEPPPHPLSGEGSLLWLERRLCLSPRSFIDNIRNVCASLTLGEIFTHGAIQYLWVSGAPGCIINRSLRGQCELITAVMMSVSDTQPYCWWNINEPGVISPHFHTHGPAFGAQIRQSGCELITTRLACVLSILMGDINLVWKQPFKKMFSDEMEMCLSSEGEIIASAVRDFRSHIRHNISAPDICNL